MHTRARTLIGVFTLSLIIPLTAVSGTAPAVAESPAPQIALAAAWNGVAIAPDGSRAWVTHTDQDLVSVVDLNARSVIATIPVQDQPGQVAVSPDGSRVYIGSIAAEARAAGRAITVIDAKTSSIVANVADSVTPTRMVVSPDNRYILSLRFATIEVVSTTTLKQVRHVYVPGDLTGISFGPRPEIAYVIADLHDLWEVNIETGARTAIPGPVEGPGIAVIADGTRAYTGGDGFGLSQADLHFASRPKPLALANSHPLPPVVTSDGLRIVTSHPADDVVVVTRIASGALEDSIPVQDPGFVAVAGNARRAAVLNAESKLTVFELDPIAAPSDVTMVRLGGIDRFDTAARIAQYAYEGGADTVFVATGEKFPDALSAAPAAAKLGAPILLVRRDSVPAVTMTELKRLAPKRIIVVGGSATVTEAVATSLGSVAPVTRLAGSDRYATSRSINKFAFAEGSAPELFVAAGEAFPDALSTSAAAGAAGMPVMLLPGRSVLSPSDGTSTEWMGDATYEETLRLGVEVTTVAGGPATFSARSYNALTLSVSEFEQVYRSWGLNRYSTSVRTVAPTAPTATTTFIATGATFPDALAGAAVSGALGAPLYLVPSNCVPAATVHEIAQNGSDTIVVLGGEKSVSASAAALTICG